MEEVSNITQILANAWPTIQPAISTAFGALVARLFLRGNTSKAEIEKIKQAKFSEVADKLLEGGHITHLEYYKCRNFNKIAQKADEVYGHLQKPHENTASNHSETAFSIDWFVRFFEDAGNISDDQIQEMWAKVLAGEIKQPGSFSLRTLDALKNLSKAEAEILRVIASYAIAFGNSYYICIDNDMQSKYNYRAKLLAMYDCGVIENNIASHFDLTAPNALMLMKIGTLVCYTHNQSEEKYHINMQRFTKTGNELIRLVSSDEEYLLDFFTLMRQKFPNLKMTVHRIVEDNGATFRYETRDLLT